MKQISSDLRKVRNVSFDYQRKKKVERLWLESLSEVLSESTDAWRFSVGDAAGIVSR